MFERPEHENLCARFFSVNRAFSPGMARLGATVWTGFGSVEGEQVRVLLGGNRSSGCAELGACSQQSIHINVYSALSDASSLNKCAHSGLKPYPLWMVSPASFLVSQILIVCSANKTH